MWKNVFKWKGEHIMIIILFSAFLLVIWIYEWAQRLKQRKKGEESMCLNGLFLFVHSSRSAPRPSRSSWLFKSALEKGERVNV